METLIWGLSESQGVLCCMDCGINKDVQAVTSTGGEGPQIGKVLFFPTGQDEMVDKASLQSPRGLY